MRRLPLMSAPPRQALVIPATLLAVPRHPLNLTASFKNALAASRSSSVHMSRAPLRHMGCMPERCTRHSAQRHKSCVAAACAGLRGAFGLTKYLWLV